MFLNNLAKHLKLPKLAELHALEKRLSPKNHVEKEYEQEIFNRTNGVPVSRRSVEELNKIAEKIGVKGIGIN